MLATMKTFFVSCFIICLGYYRVTAAKTNFLRKKDQQLYHDVAIASAVDNGHDADMDITTGIDIDAAAGHYDQALLLAVDDNEQSQASAGFRSTGRQFKSDKYKKPSKKDSKKIQQKIQQ